MDFKNREVEPKIGIVLSIVLIGFASACLFYSSIPAGFSYPLNTFLFNPMDRFADFTNQYYVAHNFNPYLNSNPLEKVYTPFTYWILGLFHKTDPISACVIFLLTAFSLTQAGFLAISYPRPQWHHYFIVPILLGLSYPIIFTIDRGNVELLTLAFLLIFACLFLNKHYAASSIFLSFAISMKLFPFLYLIVYLYRRETWRYVWVSCLSTVFVTGLSLASFSGGVLENGRMFLHGLDYFYNQYVLSYSSGGFNSCFLGAVKVLLAWNRVPNFPGRMQTLATVCGGIGLFVTLGLVGISFFKPFSWWRRFSVLAICLILFNQSSPDYRLIHLFIPLACFLREDHEEERSRIFFSVLFGLLLIPKSYFNIVRDVSISSLLNPLLLGAGLLALFTIKEKYESPLPITGNSDRPNR